MATTEENAPNLPVTDEKASRLPASLVGLGELPLVRQLVLAVVFAAALAVGVAVLLWSQEPNYRILYASLSSTEALDISTALDQAGIEYQLNSMTGAIMVAGDIVHEARLQMAGLGLPKGRGTGYELLEKDQGFSTSQFAESARYQRALEGELARTISSLNSIQSARVHLALPKQSAFVRSRRKPTASIVVNLYQGRVMTAQQAASITHMVASSIPNLEAEDVTVVDQSGRLLSSPESADDMRYTATQFDYRRKLEDYYTKRVEMILEPLLGAKNVRAQISADLDFSVIEQTQESFNPDLSTVRSEQTFEEERVGGGGVGGVPGMLANQPPGAGTTEAEVIDERNRVPRNSSKRSVRNYELDRTLSHTRKPTGTVRRLSVAIVLNERTVVDAEGVVSSEPLSENEMDRITALVKEAVGFNEQRGDSINVINAPFQTAVPEVIPEKELWEQPWVWDVAKQAAGVLGFLFLVFGVLRPVLKGLAKTKEPEVAVAMDENGQPIALDNLQEDRLSLGSDGSDGAGGEALQLEGPDKYEESLAAAKSVVAEDPKRVAQLVKQWVEVDGG